MANLGGIVASALQGGAEVVGRQAQDSIKDQRELNLRAQLSQMDEEKQQRLAESGAALKLRTDQKQREQERDFSVAPETLDAVAKLERNRDDNKLVTTGPGQQVYRNGKLVVENTNLTAADARLFGGGASGKVDHFDEKAWDAVYKADPALVSFTDPITQKARELPELRLVYQSELNKLRGSGATTPSMASEQARNVVIKLRNAAEDLANSEEGKRANLTPDAAVKQLLREFEQSRKTQAAPTTSAPPPAKPSAAAPTTSPVAGLVESARESMKAPKEDTPAESPSGKFKARQEEARQAQQRKTEEGSQQAQQMFSATDLKDPVAAQKLQDSPLFKYLSRDQKAAVSKAVMGR